MDSRQVLIISSEFPPGPGGIGKHAYDLAQALEEKNYGVTVCTSQDYCTDEEISKFNETLPANLHLVRFSRTAMATYTKRWLTIRDLIQEKKPSLVIVTGRFSLWMGYLIQRSFGDRLELHAFVHGSELRKKNRIHHFLTTKSLAKIPNLWAVSAFTRNLVQQQAGRSDIRILPNGLWTADWTLQNGKEDCRKLDGKPALLTVGRVSPRKGQHHVINALPELIQSFPGIHYHIVGIDGMKQPVVSTGEKLGVTDRVTFHGRVPSAGQLSKLYRSGDVLIMLSENQPDGEVEGFGIAILEANYFGIPAIGSKGCGIDDAISDGYNGVLVDGRNPAEVNEALKRIMGNYAQFSANAREWALRHDWHSLADGFLRKESQVFSKSDPTRQQKPAINQVHP